MKLIRKDQICAFNIHYAYYSLEYCLNSLEKLGAPAYGWTTGVLKIRDPSAAC